jgi:spermidine/putrescine transport system substrate-binding protein
VPNARIHSSVPGRDPAPGQFTTRRDFLRRSAATALALGAGGVLLEACGGSSGSGSGARANGCGAPPKLTRPDNPTTLPLCHDAIADGLDPERGTLKVLNYDAYVGDEVVAAFEREYKVKVEITAFESMEEAVDKLRNGTTAFDISNVGVDRLGSLATTATLQPLNHSYLKNIANLWPSMQNPFYDQGLRYSVPYTIYTTGIGWRTDKISAADAPPNVADATDMLFDTKYKGKIWVLDDAREAMSMALLRLGETDVNTEDPTKVAKARAELQRLVGLVNLKIGSADYQTLADGQAWITQAWSGDVISAVAGLPEGVDPAVLGYWFQPDGKGLIQSDTMAIPARAEHPVLAHHFLDFLLRPEQARANAKGIGYQMPLTAITPEQMIADGVIPTTLRTAIVRESDFVRGYEQLQLSPAGDRLWQSEWAKLTSGAG